VFNFTFQPIYRGGNIPLTDWIRGWMSPTASLGSVRGKNYCRKGTPVSQPTVISQTEKRSEYFTLKKTEQKISL
jgi:hypothetical protein